MVPVSEEWGCSDIRGPPALVWSWRIYLCFCMFPDGRYVGCTTRSLAGRCIYSAAGLLAGLYDGEILNRHHLIAPGYWTTSGYETMAWICLGRELCAAQLGIAADGVGLDFMLDIDR